MPSDIIGIGIERIIDYENDEEAFIAPGELAKYIDKSTDLLKTWRKRGGGPTFYYSYTPKGNLRIEYKLGDVNEWLKKRCWLGRKVWILNKIGGRLMRPMEVADALNSDPRGLDFASPVRFRRLCRLHEGLPFPVFFVGQNWTISNNAQSVEALLQAIERAKEARRRI